MFQSTEILQFSLLKASMFSGNIFSPMGKLFLQKIKKIHIYQCEDRFALLPPPSNQFLNETNYFSTVDMIKHQCFTNDFHQNTNQFRQANICFHQWKDLFTLLGNHSVNLIDFFQSLEVLPFWVMRASISSIMRKKFHQWENCCYKN